MSTKQKTKRLYKKAEIGLSDAMAILIFDVGMDATQDSEYLHS